MKSAKILSAKEKNDHLIPGIRNGSGAYHCATVFNFS
jgi:hypothetical protein